MKSGPRGGSGLFPAAWIAGAAFALAVAGRSAAAAEPIPCSAVVRAATTAAGARLVAADGAARAGFVLHTFWHDVEGTTASVAARLDSASGSVLIDGEVTVCVEAATLDTGIGRRDRKMREEHLEVEKYPRLEFRSTAAPRPSAAQEPRAGAAEGEGAEDAAPPARLVVEGDLTLHGVTRRVSVPVEARALPDGWAMKGAIVVRLTDYGIPDPSIALNKVRDEVDVHFDIRFSRAAAATGDRGTP